MKEYKYTIDGKEYKVAIGDIVDNVADVTVNGEQYKVEMEPEKEPEKPKPVVRPAAPAAGPPYCKARRYKRLYIYIRQSSASSAALRYSGQ